MKKQIPFRYDEELEEDFKELFKWQYYTNKKNEAITDAIELCARLSKALVDFNVNDGYFRNGKTKISELIDQLEKISKKPGKKDITKLDLKK